jgi:hypothetical protein
MNELERLQRARKGEHVPAPGRGSAEHRQIVCLGPNFKGSSPPRRSSFLYHPEQTVKARFTLTNCCCHGLRYTGIVNLAKRSQQELCFQRRAWRTLMSVAVQVQRSPGNTRV